MNRSTQSKKHGQLALRAVAAAAMAVGASQAMAVTSVTLCAEAFDKTLPVQGGSTITVPMWGYSLGACGAPTAPGPVINVPAGETTLQVTLINQMAVPTSLVIASQKLPVDGGGPVMGETVHDAAETCAPVPANALTCRVRSFTGEVAPGATRTYTFTNLRPGTFLYQTGTHPQVQMQMGLAGIMRLAAATPAYEQDLPVVLSEVDVAMHGTIRDTLGTAGNGAAWLANGNSTLKYAPNYFLVNGKPFNGITAVAGNPANTGDTDLSTHFAGDNANHTVRLRIANAGLESRSLMLNSGTWKAIGENGYAYPAPREQASLLVPAGTTADADLSVHIANSGFADQRLAFFDHRSGVRNADSSLAGGMLARIVNSDAPTIDPIADQIVNEGSTLALQVYGYNVAGYTVSSPLSVSPTGLLSWAVPTGAASTGVTVTATNGSPAPSQTFTVNVNHAPVASADGTFAAPAQTITLARNAGGTAVVNLSLSQGLLNVPAGTLTGNDQDEGIIPAVAQSIQFAGVTLFDSSGVAVALPATQLEAYFTYDAAAQAIVFRPRTASNGNGVPANALGTYAVNYQIVDPYGLSSNVATIYIKVQ